MLKKIFPTLFFILYCNFHYAQISIINSMFNAYNVTPSTLLYVNIMNNADIEEEIIIDATLYNGLNQPINHIVSSPLKLKKGLTNTAQMGIIPKTIEYSNGNDAQYIKTSHQLPSGKFKYCVIIKSANNSIEGDDLCEDFENESTSFLFLTNPVDKDTIENKYPILLWNHSDPFTLMQQGEFYRILVVELKKEQNPESGIIVNSPIFQKDFLTKHDVQYPFDAPELTTGKRYGWQVQKIINNVIVNKTEAWEFVLKPKFEPVYNKYIEIKPNYNSGTYVALGNKIFFTFNQEYFSTNKNLNVSIMPEHKENLKNVKVKEDKKNNAKVNYKEIGNNQYEIDLNDLKLNDGYYYLKIKDEKNQLFQLKFQIK